MTQSEAYLRDLDRVRTCELVVARQARELVVAENRLRVAKAAMERWRT